MKGMRVCAWFSVSVWSVHVRILLFSMCFMIHFKVFISKVFGLIMCVFSCFSMCVFMFSVWESHFFSVKVSLFSVWSMYGGGPCCVLVNIYVNKTLPIFSVLE